MLARVPREFDALISSSIPSLLCSIPTSQSCGVGCSWLIALVGHLIVSPKVPFRQVAPEALLPKFRTY